MAVRAGAGRAGIAVSGWGTDGGVLVLARPASVDVEVLRGGARRHFVVRPQAQAA